MTTWNEDFYRLSSISQAAYAYFTGYASNVVRNDLQVEDKGDFTEAQADAFVKSSDGYTLINHYPNDDAGFSASVFYSIEDGRYMIAFRGTENGWPIGDGGWDDWIPSDSDIGLQGYSRSQIISMYNWYQRLITPVGDMAPQLVYEVDDDIWNEGEEQFTYRIEYTGEPISDISAAHNQWGQTRLKLRLS